MSKKKRKNKKYNKKTPKNLVISKEKVWQAKKPRYNGFACGYGAHGKAGYDRSINKKELDTAIKNFKDDKNSENF